MIRKRQKQIDAAGKIARVQEMLEKHNKPFHDHADIDKWLSQWFLARDASEVQLPDPP